MLIREHLGARLLRDHERKELSHLALDRARIGTPEQSFQVGTALPLRRGHAPLPPKLRVRESVDVVRARAEPQVEVHGGVLAELERLEAVDDERLTQWFLWPKALVEEQTVAAEPDRLAKDGRR
jgi:hypothetical protein